MNNKSLNNIFIREAINTDSQYIIDLIFDIWVNEHQFQVKREDFPDLHQIEKYYIKDDGMFWVATISNNIVGTIAYNRLDHKQFVLKRMFIGKKYRGLGIAQSLMNKLFGHLNILEKEHNMSLFLSTKESTSLAAKNLYLKNGFKVIDKSDLPKNFPFFYKDDLFMLKNNF